MAIQLDSPVAATAKRLVTFAVSFAIIALNRRLNLNLSDVDVASLSALVVGYLAQSAWNEASQVKSEAIKAGAEAAAKVTTLDQAATVLMTPPPKVNP